MIEDYDYDLSPEERKSYLKTIMQCPYSWEKKTKKVSKKKKLKKRTNDKT